jgi:hypothetical protein
LTIVSYPTMGRRELLQGRLGNICLTEQPRLCHSAGAPSPCGLRRSLLHVVGYSVARRCSLYPRLYQRLRQRACHGSRRCSLYARLRRRYGRFFPCPRYLFGCPEVPRRRLVTGHWDYRARSRHTLEWNWFRDPPANRQPDRPTRRCYARLCLGLACCRLPSALPLLRPIRHGPAPLTCYRFYSHVGPICYPVGANQWGHLWGQSRNAMELSLLLTAKFQSMGFWRRG